MPYLDLQLFPLFINVVDSRFHIFNTENPQNEVGKCGLSISAMSNTGIIQDMELEVYFF